MVVPWVDSLIRDFFLDLNAGLASSKDEEKLEDRFQPAIGSDF